VTSTGYLFFRDLRLDDDLWLNYRLSRWLQVGIHIWRKGGILIFLGCSEDNDNESRNWGRVGYSVTWNKNHNGRGQTCVLWWVYFKTNFYVIYKFQDCMFFTPPFSLPSPQPRDNLHYALRNGVMFTQRSEISNLFSVSLCNSWMDLWIGYDEKCSFSQQKIKQINVFSVELEPCGLLDKAVVPCAIEPLLNPEKMFMLLVQRFPYRLKRIF
jgi:hypothetical protein